MSKIKNVTSLALRKLNGDRIQCFSADSDVGPLRSICLILFKAETKRHEKSPNLAFLLNEWTKPR